MPMEASMLFNIDGDIFYYFTKNTWIGDSGASCHITNDYTSLFDITNIYESIQGSSGSMLVTKRKLCINIHQVDGIKLVNTLWPCEVLPQDGCKPVFPNVQTLAGKQEFK